MFQHCIYGDHVMNTTDMGNYHTCFHPRVSHMFVLRVKVQYTIINIINPQRMQLYSRSMCVYVYYHASCYIPGLYDANKGAIRLFTAFLKYECVNFIENALFKSSGDIY